MLQRTRIEAGSLAIIIAAAAEVGQSRAVAHQLREEAQALRARATTLEQRANCLEVRAADAEAKLRKIENTAPVSEQPAGTASGLEPFALSPRDTAEAEGCAVSTVYKRIESGEYQAIKDGARTKITVASIRARQAKLPPASIKPMTDLLEARRRRREEKTAAAATSSGRA